MPALRRTPSASWRALLLALLGFQLISIGVPAAIAAGTGHDPGTTSSLLVQLPDQTPADVTSGRATLVGPLAPAAPLTVNIGLAVHDLASLQRFLATQVPRGIYLTQEEFDAQYGAPPQQVQAVTAWATTQHLHPVSVSKDGLLLTVTGSAASLGAAFRVTLNTYRRPDGSTFYANNRDVTVPANLGIAAISGLNDVALFHGFLQRATRHAAAARNGGFIPADFRAAYDLAGHGYDGTGQTIGLIFWGFALSDTDLANFATATGDTAMAAGTGPDQVEWIPVNGGSLKTDTNTQAEVALDVESAHGMATHAHLKYFLVPDQVTTCGTSTGCLAASTNLELGVSAAANDPTIHVVSDSWGGAEPTFSGNGYITNLETSFLHAKSVGTTFFFSSGDRGSASGCTTSTCALPEYPASDPSVVAVGGTTLSMSSDLSAYASETAWSTTSTSTPPVPGGSGGGCSGIFALPAFQTANGSTAVSAICGKRGVPDVAADANPQTGAATYFTDPANPSADTQHFLYGGTSLAAPLWAGMAAVANRYADLNGLPELGWAVPTLYSVATGAAGATSYHDVTTGTNGAYSAGPGWDAVTGWGSPDWYRWVQNAIGTPGSGATSTPSSTPLLATSTPSSTPLPTTNTPSNTPSNTPTETALPTNTPSSTSTNTPLPTSTPSNTPTNTPLPTNTASNTPTNTPQPIITPSNTSTNTPLPTNTLPPATATPSNTTLPATATPTNTLIPSATSTSTADPTATGTDTPLATATPTNTPIPTATSTLTATATVTNTPVPTGTSTDTTTATPTSTGTATPTGTDTATATATATATSTSRPVPTGTSTDTATATATPTSVNHTVTLRLAAGWNLISLPLSPATPLDAQTVLTTLLGTTHGSYAEIDAYANGQFAPSLFDDPGDNLGINGTNFTLQPGHGYALYTDRAGSLPVTGTPITAATTLTLAAGWNLVGFPDAGTTTYMAYNLLNTLLGATQGSYAEIDSYTNGQFSPSAFDDPGDNLGLNGTNFTAQQGQGYALYTDKNGTISL